MKIMFYSKQSDRKWVREQNEKYNIVWESFTFQDAIIFANCLNGVYRAANFMINVFR